MTIFQTFASGFAFSVCIIYALRPVAVQVGFVDTPCERKHHVGQIPLVGGVAIYAALLAMCLIFPFWRAQSGAGLVALGLPLLLIGMADDKWQLSASIRLLAEICCSLIAAVYFGIRLDDLGRLLPNLGGTLFWLAIPLTVIGTVGAVNAFNMSDGVDGLAGALAALIFGALAWLAYPTNMAVALQLTSCMAVLLGFLVFNSRFFGRRQACIFMGDGGSILIGFALVWYLILLSQGPAAVIRPVSALWLFALPLLDTVSIMSRRIARGQSPFAADREHLHHLLLLVGLSVNRVVLVILSAQMVFILFAVAGLYFKLPEWISFTLFLGVFAIYFASTRYAWKLIKESSAFVAAGSDSGLDVAKRPWHPIGAPSLDQAD